MQIAMIGLGRMGRNMARRLVRGRHSVILYDRSQEQAVEAAKEMRGARVATSLEEMSGLLKPPRVVWLMIPAGKPVDDTIDRLEKVLGKKDLVIDGGNSFYKDDIRHARQLGESGIKYMDVGVSGGIWGLKEGYCLMAGGDKKDHNHIEPILKTLAAKEGYLYCGPVGAGHFVKMVHNGIEYGLMAAYGEGFEILHSSPYSANLDLGKIAHLWNRGSVVRSWLLELVEDVFTRDKDLSGIKGYVEDSGEGRWTVEQAIESGVPAPLTAISLFERFRSRKDDSFSDKLQAALRREFGGHAVVDENVKQGRGRSRGAR
ncbi:MAG: decarboxylating 6-phosphogluconate dehydrogenase [Nitrospirae bacterium]|nr:decarboxylating 6-phosphogluconate dehydrogenase [Nitrospirota bacterium]